MPVPDALHEPLVIGEAGPIFESRPVDGRFRAQPYRADTIVDGWGGDGFVVRAASIRGMLHRYNGAPRQDELALAHLRAGPATPERLVVALADGVSSAPQSHLGALTAVRFAVQWLAERLANTPPESLEWLMLFRHAAWQLVEQARIWFAPDTDPPDPRLAEAHLATTLLCAVLEFNGDGAPAVAHVAGVGDSAAWLVTGGRFVPVFGGKATSGGSPITSSAVSGLPAVPVELAPSVLEIPPGSVFLAGTDGFGDPLGAGTGDVGRAFLDRLATPPSPLVFAHLLDFSRETFDDDRTLVAVWPRSVAAAEARGS